MSLPVTFLCTYFQGYVQLEMIRDDTPRYMGRRISIQVFLLQPILKSTLDLAIVFFEPSILSGIH